MIQIAKDKIAKIRSEVHMCRYNKALIEGKEMIRFLDLLEDVGIDLNSGKVTKQHLTEELKLVEEIMGILQNSNVKNIGFDQFAQNGNPKKSQEVNKRIAEDRHFVSNNSMNTFNQTQQSPGKWGKKKQSKNSSIVGKEQPIKQISFTHKVRVEESKPATQQHQSEILQQNLSLEQDEDEILQRQIILPMNLPHFFKKKQPHRLIVCYFKKCQDLLKNLMKRIPAKKKIISLENIGMWTPTGECDEIKIYVAPFELNFEDTIISILEDSGKNILLLYSEVDRMILTQKLPQIKRETFTLRF